MGFVMCFNSSNIKLLFVFVIIGIFSLSGKNLLAETIAPQKAISLMPQNNIKTEDVDHFEHDVSRRINNSDKMSFDSKQLKNSTIPLFHKQKTQQVKSIKKDIQAKTDSLQSATSVSTTPSVVDALQFSGSDLVNYIVSHNSVSSYPDFFSANLNTFALYSEENMIYLGNEITLRSNSYQGSDRQGMDKILAFARAAYVINFYYPNELSWTSLVATAINKGIAAFIGNDLFLTDNTTEHSKVVFQLVSLMDGAGFTINYIDDLLKLMDTFPKIQGTTNSTHLNVLYSIHYTFYRQNNNSQTFRDAMNAKVGIVSHFKNAVDRLEFLQAWGNGSNIPAGYYANSHNNAIGELSRLMSYSNHFADAEAATVQLLNKYERLSLPWFQAVNGILYYGDCSKFVGICREDLEAELNELLFPNTYTFDDGNLIIRTAVDESVAQELYHAQKQVEAQFKREKQDLTAIDMDPNQVLTMFIYGSRDDYVNFQGFLFGLNSNNGGIYIEQWGQFFTYQRTEQESIYSLEELFRHEYVHYLNGRFAVDGMWGNTEFYSNNRLVWFDEGSAEYFAGSTQSNGVSVRKNMVQQIANDGVNRLTVSDVMNSSYSSGFKFYRYSALFFNYLSENNPELITELYKLVRSNDIAGFDAKVAEMSGDAGLQTNYNMFLDAQITKLELMDGFMSIQVPALNTLNIDNVDDVQAAIRTELMDASCAIAAVNMNRRFACTGTLVANQVFDFDMILDNAIDTLTINSADNFSTMNCAYGVVTEGINFSTNYYCEGALSQMTNSPTGMVVISGTFTEDQTLIASNTLADADGMGVISYTWKRDGVEIATGDSYVLNNADVDHRLTVEASYTDGSGNLEIVSSAATAIITALEIDNTGDSDNDGLTDLVELQMGTDPNNNDSDADGMDDGFEVANGFNPLDTLDAMSDSDSDGLTNLDEFNAGTDPNNNDTDGDGLGDAFEIDFGLDPFVNDAASDVDGDNLTNLEEMELGTNPTLADSDGDGVNDNIDFDPLNASLSTVTGSMQILGDLTGDDIPEIGFYSLDLLNNNRPSLVVQDGLTSNWVRTFTATPGSKSVHDMGDMSGDGIDEVGFYSFDSANNNTPTLMVFDGQTTQLSMTFTIDPERWNAQSLHIINDMTGDGIAEVGFYSFDLDKSNVPALVVQDGVTGALLRTFSLNSNRWDVQSVHILNDMTGDTVPEVGFYSIDRNKGDKPVFAILDGFTNNQLKTITVKSGRWIVQSVHIFDDITGDGIADIGFYSLDSKKNNKPSLLVYNGASRSLIKTYSPGSARWDVQSVHIIDDMTGDGIAEVGFYSLDSTNGNLASLVVLDGESNNMIRTISAHPEQSDIISFHIINDMSGDGIPDIGYYGFDMDSNLPSLMVQNGVTTAVLNVFSVDSNRWSL